MSVRIKQKKTEVQSKIKRHDAFEQKKGRAQRILYSLDQRGGKG